MIRYRIYLGLSIPNSTAEYDKQDAINHIKTLFDYCTIYQGQGIYKSKSETTLIIEYITADNFDMEIKNVCKYLKNRYNQECVMFTKDIAKMEVI